MTSIEAIFHGQLFGISLAEFHLAQAGFLAERLARSSMAGVMSTPITLPAGPTWRAARKASMPAAAADIQHHFARLDARHCGGVAAAQGQLGCFGRYGGLLGRRVPGKPVDIFRLQPLLRELWWVHSSSMLQRTGGCSSQLSR